MVQGIGHVQGAGPQFVTELFVAWRGETPVAAWIQRAGRKLGGWDIRAQLPPVVAPNEEHVVGFNFGPFAKRAVVMMEAVAAAGRQGYLQGAITFTQEPPPPIVEQG
jgi:hypothetical protein